MIDAEDHLHLLRGTELITITKYRYASNRSHSQRRNLWWCDNRDEGKDVQHAEIRHLERGALQLLLLDRACTCPSRQILDLASDRTQLLSVGVAHDRRGQSLIEGDSNADVDRIMLHDSRLPVGVRCVATIECRKRAQCPGGGLHNHVVDGNLAVGCITGVDLRAQSQR